MHTLKTVNSALCKYFSRIYSTPILHQTRPQPFSFAPCRTRTASGARTGRLGAVRCRCASACLVSGRTAHSGTYCLPPAPVRYIRTFDIYYLLTGFYGFKGVSSQTINRVEYRRPIFPAPQTPHQLQEKKSPPAYGNLE